MALLQQACTSYQRINSCFVQISMTCSVMRDKQLTQCCCIAALPHLQRKKPRAQRPLDMLQKKVTSIVSAETVNWSTEISSTCQPHLLCSAAIADKLLSHATKQDLTIRINFICCLRFVGQSYASTSTRALWGKAQYRNVSADSDHGVQKSPQVLRLSDPCYWNRKTGMRRLK